MSNYAIKKILPRLVIVAILLNTSFIICSLAVDLSNFLGYGLYSLLKGGAITDGLAASGVAEGTWSNIGAVVLASGAVVGLIVLVVLAPSVLLAVGLILLILIARQALVVLLIVAAPIAFVLYLLPNTEDWFKKWGKAFVAVLMVFPLIGLVFGASSLASDILMAVANRDNGDDREMLQLVALATLAIPLFSIPTLLSASFKGLGIVGARLSGATDKAAGQIGRASGKAGNRVGNRAGEYATRYKNRIKANLLSNERDGRILGRANSKRRQAARWLAGRGVTREQTNKYAEIGKDAAERNYFARQTENDTYANRIAGGDAGMASLVKAYGEQAVHEEDEKDVKAQTVLLKGRGLGELHSIMANANKSVAERAGAAELIAQNGGHQHVQQAFDTLMRSPMTDDMAKIQKLASDSLLRRKPAGVSATTANAMRSGSMHNDQGLMGEFRYRLEEGKFGAQELAGMDLDDHLRIAELANSGRLSDGALQRLSSQLNEIAESDTMKLTPEQERILTGATYRQESTTADGQPRAPLVPI